MWGRKVKRPGVESPKKNRDWRRSHQGCELEEVQRKRFSSHLRIVGVKEEEVGSQWGIHGTPHTGSVVTGHTEDVPETH